MPWTKIDRIRGINGSNGANGANGINGTAVLHGQGSPSNSLGSNGDFYVDTDNNRFFGPKALGIWSGFVSMVGIQGPIGPTGASGGIGPAGERGERGESGGVGPQGPSGVVGSAGVNGVDGRTILSGSGSPPSGAGSTGDFYIDKTAWSIYGPKTVATGWGAPTNLIGAQGAAATIAVGSVTGIAAGQNATVTNVGTPSAAIINFAIPAGATGAAGTNATTTATATSGANGLMSSADVIKLAKLAPRSYVATATITKPGTTTTESTLIAAGNGSLIVPSAIFDTPGVTFRFEASGKYTNVLLGAITLKIKIGSIVTLSAVLSFPVLAGKAWIAKGTGTVRAGRVVLSSATIDYDNGTSNASTEMFLASTATIPAGDQTVDFTGQWGVIVGGASFTVDQLFLDIIPSP